MYELYRHNRRLILKKKPPGISRIPVNYKCCAGSLEWWKTKYLTYRLSIAFCTNRCGRAKRRNYNHKKSEVWIFAYSWNSDCVVGNSIITISNLPDDIIDINNNNDFRITTVYSVREFAGFLYRFTHCKLNWITRRSEWREQKKKTFGSEFFIYDDNTVLFCAMYRATSSVIRSNRPLLFF